VAPWLPAFLLSFGWLTWSLSRLTTHPALTHRTDSLGRRGKHAGKWQKLVAFRPCWRSYREQCTNNTISEESLQARGPQDPRVIKGSSANWAACTAQSN